MSPSGLSGGKQDDENEQRWDVQNLSPSSIQARAQSNYAHQQLHTASSGSSRGLARHKQHPSYIPPISYHGRSASLEDPLRRRVQHQHDQSGSDYFLQSPHQSPDLGQNELSTLGPWKHLSARGSRHRHSGSVRKLPISQTASQRAKSHRHTQSLMGDSQPPDVNSGSPGPLVWQAETNSDLPQGDLMNPERANWKSQIHPTDRSSISRNAYPEQTIGMGLGIGVPTQGKDMGPSLLKSPSNWFASSQIAPANSKNLAYSHSTIPGSRQSTWHLPPIHPLPGLQNSPRFFGYAGSPSFGGYSFPETMEDKSAIEETSMDSSNTRSTAPGPQYHAVSSNMNPSPQVVPQLANFQTPQTMYMPFPPNTRLEPLGAQSSSFGPRNPLEQRFSTAEKKPQMLIPLTNTGFNSRRTSPWSSIEHTWPSENPDFSHIDPSIRSRSDPSNHPASSDDQKGPEIAADPSHAGSHWNTQAQALAKKPHPFNSSASHSDTSKLVSVHASQPSYDDALVKSAQSHTTAGVSRTQGLPQSSLGGFDPSLRVTSIARGQEGGRPIKTPAGGDIGLRNSRLESNDTLMNIPDEKYDDDAKYYKWTPDATNELLKLLYPAEKYKWKFISDNLSERQEKRIPLKACKQKFEALFGEAEASSALQSSLFYIAYRSGWDTIRTTQTGAEAETQGIIREREEIYDRPDVPEISFNKQKLTGKAEEGHHTSSYHHASLSEDSELQNFEKILYEQSVEEERKGELQAKDQQRQQNFQERNYKLQQQHEPRQSQISENFPIYESPQWYSKDHLSNLIPKGKVKLLSNDALQPVEGLSSDSSNSRAAEPSENHTNPTDLLVAAAEQQSMLDEFNNASKKSSDTSRPTKDSSEFASEQ